MVWHGLGMHRETLAHGILEVHVVPCLHGHPAVHMLSAGPAALLPHGCTFLLQVHALLNTLTCMRFSRPVVQSCRRAWLCFHPELCLQLRPAACCRGAALEMLLSKLVACRAVCSVQIVAMSATMTGLDSLSAWLNAHLFLTNFRPVPLSEHVVFQGTVFIKAGMQGKL